MSLKSFHRRSADFQVLSLGLLSIVLIGATKGAADPVGATRMLLQKAKSEAVKSPRAPMVPRDVYLRRPEILDVRLSPNGRHVSFVRRADKGIDVMLHDLSSGAQSRIVAGLQRAETAWSGDGARLWLADDQGLAVIETARSSAKRVIKWNVRTKQRLWAVDPRAPHVAIIHERVVQAGAERHRYLSVDANGRTRLLIDAALPLRSALLRARGDLAFTAAFDGARYETAIRQHTAAGAREIMRCSSIEECRLVGYNEEQQSLWILSPHDKDKLSLRRWQKQSGKWETVHRDLTTDVDGLLWSSARQMWLAVAHHDGHRRWQGGDRGTQARITALEKVLPGANLQLSATNDGRVWLVHAQQGELANDRYYIYRPEQNRMQPLFAREDNAKRALPRGAKMHAVSYRARDGMLLHGYVMLPSGVAPRSAPLIAWLHGGPITRMYDRYDPAMQLLVNRGYAVFVPNFRASTGYGLSYVLAAKGDVGNGRVLSDVIDGMDFLLAAGIGDRNRQAVMGMSFGGYASLLAVSHHASRFRFAFAGAPPTEYGWIKQWQADHDSEALRPDGPPLSLQFPQLGFPYKDSAWRQRMIQESPLKSVPSLKASVYIWAGARDDRVPLKSIVNYVAAAHRLGKRLNVLLDPDGGHTPATALGAEAWLYQIEVAAHRHLGGSLSPVPPELSTFLRRNVRIDTDARVRTRPSR